MKYYEDIKLLFLLLNVGVWILLTNKHFSIIHYVRMSVYCFEFKMGKMDVVNLCFNKSIIFFHDLLHMDAIVLCSIRLADELRAEQVAAQQLESDRKLLEAQVCSGSLI